MTLLPDAAANASLADLATNELAQQAKAAATEQIAAEADFHAVNKALETADTELTAATCGGGSRRNSPPRQRRTNSQTSSRNRRTAISACRSR